VDQTARLDSIFRTKPFPYDSLAFTSTTCSHSYHTDDFNKGLSVSQSYMTYRYGAAGQGSAGRQGHRDLCTDSCRNTFGSDSLVAYMS
jgi:hypothetical protein